MIPWTEVRLQNRIVQNQIKIHKISNESSWDPVTVASNHIRESPWDAALLGHRERRCCDGALRRSQTERGLDGRLWTEPSPEIWREANSEEGREGQEEDWRCLRCTYEASEKRGKEEKRGMDAWWVWKQLIEREGAWSGDWLKIVIS